MTESPFSLQFLIFDNPNPNNIGQTLIYTLHVTMYPYFFGQDPIITRATNLQSEKNISIS